jgi:serine/threonine-protein kinase
MGRLSHAELQAIEPHVSSCEKCVAVLEDLRRSSKGDSVVARLKAYVRDVTLPEDAAFEAMIAAAARRETADGAAPKEIAGRTALVDRFSGRVIGPYLILYKIGAGGMGVVYRAVQKPAERTVALKMILMGEHARPEAVSRFATEAKAAARLHHPNIVQIYDVGQLEGLPYFTMEFVEGGRLDGKLAAGALPPREAAELIATLAKAVAYAHAQNVVHRDLKPSNVLLTQDGIPKITDFGLAKILDADTSQQTQTDVILGTPSYMSPEQAWGDVKAIGPATDIHALGALLFEALCGAPAFRGPTKPETLNLVRTREAEFPPECRRTIPRALQEICLKCLEKSPTRRYRSAQAVADDIERWLRNERPLQTPGLLERTRRRLRRRPVAALLAFVLVVGAVAAYAFYQSRPLTRIHAELDAGNAAALLDPSGKPRWSRWCAGQAWSQLATVGGEALALHTTDLAMVELLPDPRSERYRFSARVRHTRSSLPGGVGIFAALQEPGGTDKNPLFFVLVRFNDVRKIDVSKIPILRGRPLPKADNVAELAPRLVFDGDGPSLPQWSAHGRTGPMFAPAGEGLATWRELSLTVTPEKVRAEWDGHAFEMSAAEIASAVEAMRAAPVRSSETVEQMRRLKMSYTPRGGLGVYLERGSAMFIDVKVTPLAN